MIRRTRKKILELLKTPEKLLQKNINNTVQYRNFCYFVSGIELFLSSKTFISFAAFYQVLPEDLSELEKKNSEQIGNWFELILQYIIAKPDYQKTSSAIEKLAALTEKAGFQTGEQDDLNVIFIFMQRSFLFNCLFSFYDICDNKIDLRVGPLYAFDIKGIYPVVGLIFLKNNGNPLELFLNNPRVISIALKSGPANSGHYSVFQKISVDGKPKFISKNNGFYTGQNLYYILFNFE